MDLAPGITVNAIAPGTVLTNMIEQVVTDRRMHGNLKMVV